jgi:hypothetical protein
MKVRRKNGESMKIQKFDGSFRPVQFREGFFIDEYPVLCKIEITID